MSQKKNLTIVVVGGGLAGLSAVSVLSRYLENLYLESLRQGVNFKVKIIERAPFAGGCTSSWPDHRDPEKGEIQYPMHMIFSSLYVNFIEMIQYLNLMNNLTSRFDRFFFFDEKGKRSCLGSSPLAEKLPAPLHGLKILWDFDGCSMIDKLSTVRFFLFCLRYGGQDVPPASDQYNFYGFCKKLGMTEEAVKTMARITYSITNLPPSEQVGPKFSKLFYETILSASDALGYRMVNDNYNPGLINPWVGYLKELGVEFYFNHEVKGINCEDGKVVSVEAVDHTSGLGMVCLNCGVKFPTVSRNVRCPKCGIFTPGLMAGLPDNPRLTSVEGDYFISCLQPHQLAGIIARDAQHPFRQYAYFRNLWKYKGASLSISRIWLDKKYTREDNLTGLDRHFFSFNGIMDISNIMPERYREGSVFDTLSDDGDSLKLWLADEFKAKLVADMRRVFPETSGAKVIRHNLAHIYPSVLYHLPTPEISSVYRPKSQQSPIDNFVLGGDWISSLEIGMEGAVKSGLDAANLILQKENLRGWPIKQPKRGWIMEKLERFNR